MKPHRSEFTDSNGVKRDREWRKKIRDNSYGSEEKYEPYTWDANVMIQKATQSPFVEQKVERLRELVALMFDAMPEDKQVEVMEMFSSNWELE